MKKLAILMALLVLITPAGLLAQQTATVTLSLVVTHAAILTWDASSTQGVTQYNVYRGTATGGPYTKITSGNFLTYSDKNVASGTTYFWVVTAVNSGGESGFSNEVSGAIP